MKAITDPTKLPKFLVCNEIPERDWSWNKHLPKPWTKGEIVKVQPAETQKHDPTYDHIHLRVKPYTDEEFRERFVRIIRKDSEGKWTLKQVGEWCQFDLLKSIKKV